ncbi:MAG: HD-GYP domain-containing protein [Planctomycetaceae bacterium]
MISSATVGCLNLSPEEIAASLESELETSVSVWSCPVAEPGVEWKPVVSVEAHERDEVIEWLGIETDRLLALETVVVRDGANILRVATPIQRKRRPLLVAVAELVEDAAEAIARTARNAVRVVALSHQAKDLSNVVEGYVQQVTNDLEEMTYLRRVTRFLEYLDLSQDVDDVAERILPKLRELLQVEGVLLITPRCGQADEPMPGQVSVREQGERFSDEQCLNITASLSTADSAPVVRNLARHPELQALHPDLHSISIVTIARGANFYGWLLAVNRNANNPCAVDYATSEQELGTIEASLMESTAVLLSSHAHNVQAFRSKEELVIEVVRSLVAMLDARDQYTCGHSDRVAAMARHLAHLRGLSPAECETIYLTGLLHDIGKIGVPDEVLRKPGRLTAEEFALIQEHPQRGYDILRGIQPLQATLAGVLHHHESLDGSGYPHGLKGDEIPLIARILAVVDTFDALTSERPYRAPRTVDEAVAVLRQGRGQQWDAELVDLFLGATTEFVSICDGSIGLAHSPLQQAKAHEPTMAARIDDSLRNAVRGGALQLAVDAQRSRQTSYNSSVE